MENKDTQEIFRAQEESNMGEKGKNKCEYALNILNWLEKISNSEDQAYKQRLSKHLLSEIIDQAFEWQIGRHQENSTELDTGGTQGEAVALLVAHGVLKDFPTFEINPRLSSQINYVDTNPDEILVSFNIEHPDTYEIKRGVYKFSDDKEIINMAIDRINKQKSEFVKQQYGWKKIGSALRFIREKKNKVSESILDV